jgi:tyrosinase
MNSFAAPSLVTEVNSKPDYTTWARAVENVPDFNFPNLHGSGHFGIGGVLGTMGDAYNSPGGMY